MNVKMLLNLRVLGFILAAKSLMENKMNRFVVLSNTCLQVAVLCGGKTAPCTASSACLRWLFDGSFKPSCDQQGPQVPGDSVRAAVSGAQLHVNATTSPDLLSFIIKVLHHCFYLSLAKHASIFFDVIMQQSFLYMYSK